MNKLMIILLLLAMPVMAFDGICPYCKKEGKKSCVYQMGCSSTLMATYSYYDENGNYHFEDNNITTCDYKCSNGHSFITKNGGLIINQDPNSTCTRPEQQKRGL